MPSHIDKEKAKKTISLILNKMTTEADPQLLGEYNSLFKKEVSFFRRSWAAAYLLMQCDQEKSIRTEGSRRSSRRAWGDRPAPASRDGDSNDAGRGDDTPQYPLSEDESKRLFFSVGRSRRVFPREILGLINAKTAIAKENIGSIRILDNYSFVQVRDTVAEEIIEALNGITFRGRTLTVNYAKFRKDEEENGTPDDVYEENEPPEPAAE